MKKSNIRTELIYIYIKTSNITKTEFCKKCKISLKTLNKIMEGEENINPLTIGKIAEVLHLRRHQMYDDLK